MIAMDKPAMMKDLKSVSNQYDFVLVDGCPKSMGMIAVTVTIADIVMIPVQPSGLDLWAANSVVDLIKQHQEIAQWPTEGGVYCQSANLAHQNWLAKAEPPLQELGLPYFSQLYESTHCLRFCCVQWENCCLTQNRQGISEPGSVCHCA